MAQYDLYPHSDGRGVLLDLQSDLLDRMATRIVAPLLPQDVAPLPARRLNPVFEVGGVPHILMIQLLAAVPVTILGTPAGSLADEADAVTAALDMVFHGF